MVIAPIAIGRINGILLASTGIIGNSKRYWTIPGITETNEDASVTSAAFRRKCRDSLWIAIFLTQNPGRLDLMIVDAYLINVNTPFMPTSLLA